MRKEDMYDGIIKASAQAQQLDWLQIKAQIKQESAFDARAVSPVGAEGLGQFMPATWAEWGMGRDILDPMANIDAICRYMCWLLERFSSDWEKALAAYNWGIGNVRKAVAHNGDKWKSVLPAETAHYLVQINKYYEEYRNAPVKVAA